MGDKQIGLKFPLKGSKPGLLREAGPISFLESKVRFSFRDCDTKRFCIRTLADDEICRFYARLGYLETYSWHQAIQLARENGFSVEKKESSNYKMLSGIKPEFSTFYHFRVTGLKTPFRVFGGQKDDLCYVLLIDKRGKLNH